jgi:DNA-directed RNA polymerase subunit K/omega
MAPPKKKQPTVEPVSDDEPFVNSEDEYAYESEDENSMYGGSVGDDLGDDENTIEDDVDDEFIDGEDDEAVEDDGIYDPINEADENEDADEDIGEDDEYAYDEEETGTEAGEEGEGEIEDEEGEGAGEPDEEGAGSKVCHYKSLNDDFIVISEDDSKTYGALKPRKIPDEERISGDIMTYYEMVAVIGIREQQLKHRAPPLIKGIEGMHPAHIAYIELLMRATPHVISRRMPNKEYEEWKISELRILHAIDEPYYNPGGPTMNRLIRQARLPLDESKGQNLDFNSVS